MYLMNHQLHRIVPIYRDIWDKWVKGVIVLVLYKVTILYIAPIYLYVCRA